MLSKKKQTSRNERLINLLLIIYYNGYTNAMCTNIFNASIYVTPILQRYKNQRLTTRIGVYNKKWLEALNLLKFHSHNVWYFKENAMESFHWKSSLTIFQLDPSNQTRNRTYLTKRSWVEDVPY